MRFKVVIPVLVGAMALICVVLGLRPRSQSAAPATAPGAVDAGPRAATVSAARVMSRTNKPMQRIETITVPAPPAQELSEEEREAQDQVIAERIHELNEWAATDDPNNLRQILAELDDPEPQIRAAAVEAAVQFKSPDAIPALQEAFDRATDLDEKLQIRNAIQFLTPDVATSNQ